MMKHKIIRSVTVPQSLGLVEPMIQHLKQKYEVQLLSSPGEKIDKICQEYHIVGHRVEMYRRMSPIKDIKSLWNLIKLFIKSRIYSLPFPLNRNFIFSHTTNI